MHSGLLIAIGVSIVAASLLAYLAQYLRQPPILGYITAGLLIGPYGFGFVRNQEDITALSELGLAFLLFIVGLEIDVKKFVRSGTASAIIGVIQATLCSLFGFFVAQWLGYTGLDAVYIGVALAFSSTMIVVKLLSDRGELDTLPGRISLGILLVQDALAIFVLAGQGNINNPSFLPIAASILSGLGLVLISFLVSRYVLPAAFRQIARNPELVLILSIAWCFVMCGLALKADFSIAMGALIAGISISTFPYSHEVIIKIRSLRDFFVTLFFVSLGMQLIITSGSLVVTGLLLSLFIILSRVLTIFPTAYALRLGSRVGFLSSLALAQSSEFSLVIATLGLSYEHISREIVSLIAITLVVTSTLTTYLVRSSHTLARGILPFLESFGIKSSHHQQEESVVTERGEIVILGCHRLGSSLVNILTSYGIPVHVFDFNPLVLTHLKERGIRASYVDISQFDSLEEAGVDEASVVVSTVSDDFLRGTDNYSLLRYIKSRGGNARVIVQANSAQEAIQMYEAGADYVILPNTLAAQHVAQVIEAARETGYEDHRKTALARLKQQRDEV
ncbi:MAG: cation:proton antiporter [Ignavibacteriales bacterium]|nr:cation:proton antiporter [Ignavibacteriales bacterium]